MKKICGMIALMTTVLFFGIQVKAQIKPLEPDAPIQKLYQELKQKLCENKSKFVLTKRLLDRRTETILIFEGQQSTVYVAISSHPSKERAEEQMESHRMMVSNAGPSNRLDAFGDVAFASERWIGFVHNTLLVVVTVSPKLGFEQKPVQETTSHQSVSAAKKNGDLYETIDLSLSFQGPGKTSLRATHPVAREFAEYLWEAVINLQK